MAGKPITIKVEAAPATGPKTVAAVLAVPITDLLPALIKRPRSKTSERCTSTPRGSRTRTMA